MRTEFLFSIHFQPLIRGQNKEREEEGEVATATEPFVKEPRFYRIILLNDDFTPMDFVVHILQRFFNKSLSEATEIMMEVHHKGAGVAGLYPLEVAETKVYQVNEYSKKKRYPLKCVMEEV